MPSEESSHRLSEQKVAALVIREHDGRAFYEAKFRHDGRQVKRRVGPAWLDRNGSGTWRPRRGRVADGFYDERRAHIRAAELIAAYVKDVAELVRVEQERRMRGVIFREVAMAYLIWLERVKGAKPATLRQHRSDLAEPGVEYRHGEGVTAGHIMKSLGDRPAAKITTAEVEALLDAVAATGVSPRTVNRVRAVVSAVFGFGVKSSRYKLPANPVSGADKRREPQRGALVYYSLEEVEAAARALADGLHREGGADEVGGAEDRQDAEAVRVAAYAGLRLGELLALRWRDVDWTGSALTIGRALSAGVETSTKSGHVRRVPLADRAAAALDRLSQRGNFTESDDLVFINSLGRGLDGSALRRRYKRARNAAGLRPLRWHDLRHTFGSLLAHGGVDLVTIQHAMGHSQLATTSRYLHARPATETADRFNKVFGTATAPNEAAVTSG